MAQTGGSSYTKSLNIDLNSSKQHTTNWPLEQGDEIGVALLNSNGGSGSETGAYYPTFDNKTSLGLSSQNAGLWCTLEQRLLTLPIET